MSGRRIGVRAALRAVVAGAAVLFGGAARADLLFFNNQADFQSAYSGLAEETFQSAQVGAGSYSIVDGPLDATTNDGVFQPGNLLPGFAVSGAGNEQMVVVGDGTVPGATKAVSVLNPNSPLKVSFDAAQTAVGMNLFASAGPGNLASQTVHVDVFGNAGLLGSEDVNLSGTSTFVGVASTMAAMITGLAVSNPVSLPANTFIDNLMFGAGSPAYTIFHDRAAFDAANPGNSTETFESARVPSGTFTTVPGPIGSTTEDGVFHPGDLLPGFALSGIGSESLVILGSGTVPGATKGAGVQNPNSPLELTFGSGTQSAGFDLFASANPGVVSDQTSTIRVFGTSGLLYEGTLATTGADTFFGFESSQGLITRIEVAGPASSPLNNFVDNLSFQSTASGAVPEPSSLAMLATALVALGGASARRRSGLRRRGAR